MLSKMQTVFSLRLARGPAAFVARRSQPLLAQTGAAAATSVMGGSFTACCDRFVVGGRGYATSLPLWHSDKSGSAASAAAKAAAPTQSGPIGVEPVRGALKPPRPKLDDEKCGDPIVDDGDEDMVPMIDPATQEWNGPTRGGQRPEPTRHGDWHTKGRCTDFS